MLEIAREQTANNSLELISLKGSLDSHTAHDFDRFFQEFIQAGFHFLILDASLLQTVSSSGLASIARLAKDIENLKGVFAFLNLPSEIGMLFSFLTLTKRIPIFSNMEEALNFFAAGQEGNTPFHSQGVPQGKVPEVEAEVAYGPFNRSGLGKAEREGVKALVACTHCGLQLSAKKSGPYMCPGCGQQFQVNL